MIEHFQNTFKTPNDNFQPMNANFELYQSFQKRLEIKKLKYEKLANIAIGVK